MHYLSCKKIENDVYNFPTWQYCKYKDIFDSRIIINSTAKFYISISYQKDLLSIDTRIFTPSEFPAAFFVYVDVLFAALRTDMCSDLDILTLDMVDQPAGDTAVHLTNKHDGRTFLI